MSETGPSLQRPATRAARLSAIEQALATHIITSQSQLSKILIDEGIAVTQATLSRDLDEMHAVKTRLKDGTVAEQDLPAELLQLGGIFARMVSSCPIVIFQCRDNRNDSDPSPFVHLVVHTTILEIKRRNPNPSPIGMMFGFLGFGGAT